MANGDKRRAASLKQSTKEIAAALKNDKGFKQLQQISVRRWERTARQDAA